MPPALLDPIQTSKWDTRGVLEPRERAGERDQGVGAMHTANGGSSEKVGRRWAEVPPLGLLPRWTRWCGMCLGYRAGTAPGIAVVFTVGVAAGRCDGAGVPGVSAGKQGIAGGGEPRPRVWQ